MNARTDEGAPQASGRGDRGGAAGAGGAPRAGKRPSLFAIVTLAAGIIAMALIAWRISKAWRIEYGGGPREPRPIPTTGAFGPPGGAAAPASPGPSGAAPAR